MLYSVYCVMGSERRGSDMVMVEGRGCGRKKRDAYMGRLTCALLLITTLVVILLAFKQRHKLNYYYGPNK